MPTHASHAIEEPIFAPIARFHQGRFGRMFRNIPPWDPGGASDIENVDIIAGIAESVFKPGSKDNPGIPAAYTFFGQFIDHDITLDTTSSLDRLTDPERIHNFRTPRLDLDCVYGRGPKDQPFLYEGPSRIKMVIGKGKGAKEPDLPRLGNTALIGDPRNDENILVSQIHLQMLMFHNAMLERLLKLPKYPKGREKEAFAEAQRLTRWHYQWVVIHDFAERICGLELIHELLDQPFNAPPRDGHVPGRPRLKFYNFSDLPFMPIEFSVAGFRFGHSLVRDGYKLNGKTSAPIFDDAGGDLRGGRILPALHTIQWDRLVQYKGSTPAASQLIDTTLAKPLMSLPDSVVDDAATEVRNRSLAFRNILRGHRLSLPSGQRIARRMCVPKSKIIDSDKELPLWVYILKEAEELEKGEKLGPVGGRIVGETLVGLLAGDAFSYFSVDPCWEPDAADGGRLFNLAKLLETAGAPMTAAQLPF